MKYFLTCLISATGLEFYQIMLFQKIYNIVRFIPTGKVLTYKAIAYYLRLKDIRLIGYALHRNPDSDNIPCHRVVKSDGSLANGFAFGGPSIQKQLLQQEKVDFDHEGKINLSKFLWEIPKKYLHQSYD